MKHNKLMQPAVLVSRPLNRGLAEANPNSYMSKTSSALMNPKNYKKWKTIREKGKFRYIFLNGVLGFGGTSTLATVGGLLITNRLDYDRLFTTGTLILMVIGLIAGLIFGIGTWFTCESVFRHHSRTRNDT